MTTRLLSLSAAALALGATCLINPDGRGQTGADPSGQQGVEVLTYGPVHEAFAEPSDPNPKPQPIVPKQPPGPIEEVPPEQKPEGQDVEWIPGYFYWDDERSDFLWVSGFWRDIPPG